MRYSETSIAFNGYFRPISWVLNKRRHHLEFRSLWFLQIQRLFVNLIIKRVSKVWSTIAGRNGYAGRMLSLILGLILGRNMNLKHPIHWITKTCRSEGSDQTKIAQKALLFGQDLILHPWESLIYWRKKGHCITKQLKSLVCPWSNFWTLQTKVYLNRLRDIIYLFATGPLI
jgi:hypothetical protein